MAKVEYEELSRMYSDMVFLNDKLSKEIEHLFLEFNKFKTEVAYDLRQQLHKYNSRLNLIEMEVCTPERTYIKTNGIQVDV